MITALRALEPPQLPDFVEEIKRAVIERVTDKIPHLESSLAVAELTVALHYVLRTPEDVLIWDVGHQGYIHKALTGRLEDLRTMRQPGGISGFLRRDESPYDFFGAGHASTSISALAGVCLADSIAGRERHRVAVIGDGAMTGGQAFEAFNHLGGLEDQKALVILNDNDGSIDQTMGALGRWKFYAEYFESMGWGYRQLRAGNDVQALVEAIKAGLHSAGPMVLHIRTHRPNLHPEKSYKEGTTFQWFAAQKMQEIFEQNNEIQLISPAMFAGSGFGPLREKYGHHMHDTGINEAHAVTMAGAMVAAGAKAWVHIYSTFLQRAFDQVIHDIALQELPVVFLVDRAGLVGADGATHHGIFDSNLLVDIPGVTIWNPMNGEELKGMMSQAVHWNEGPLFIRYPKDTTTGADERTFEPWRRLSSNKDRVALVSTGRWSNHHTSKDQEHFHITQIKPFPSDLSMVLKDYEEIVVREETMGHGGLVAIIESEMRLLGFKGTIRSERLPEGLL